MFMNFLTDFLLQETNRTKFINTFGTKPKSALDLDTTTILIICACIAALIAGIVLFYIFIRPLIAKQKQFKALFDALVEANNLAPEETRMLIDAAKRFNLTNLSLIMVSRSLVEKYFEEKMSVAAGAEKEILSRQLQGIRIKLFS